MDEQSAAGRIADAFEAGIAPWSRSHRLGLTCGLPADARTGQTFRGVNLRLLELAAIEGKYRSPHWATREGWYELGAVGARQVGAGVLDRDLTDVLGEGESLLYNLEQVEVRPGRPVTPLNRLRVAKKASPDYDMAERVLRASGVRVVEDDFAAA
jgi:hypothetical protein